MSNSTLKTTTPDDFIMLTSYKSGSNTVKGNFPIYITGVSKCCLGNDGVQKIIPIIVPKSK
jgi:hypothetical protein